MEIVLAFVLTIAKSKPFNGGVDVRMSVPLLEPRISGKLTRRGFLLLEHARNCVCFNIYGCPNSCNVSRSPRLFFPLGPSGNDIKKCKRIAE